MSQIIMDTYRVKKIFKSVQSEGFHTGILSVIVNFSGCNIWSGNEAHREVDASRSKAQCPLWCDANFTSENSELYNTQALVSEILRVADDCRVVLLTGGEPLRQVKTKLIEALQHREFYVCIETNGTYKLGDRNCANFVTVSPKLSDNKTVIVRCDEAKFVVPYYHPSDYPKLVEKAKLVSVSPEGDTKQNILECLAIIYSAKDGKTRLSLRMNKMIEI